MRKLLTILTVLGAIATHAQQVTITIGYPDHPDYFLYAIPPTDEHARFGGEYYFKVENTGNVDLLDFELTTFWKALNSTWGVVDKTVLNSITGEILLTGPSWDPDLNVGESFVLNGEWVPSASIEDWIEFLPRDISMTANGVPVTVLYDTQGEVNLSNYVVEKTIPFSDDRKTFSNLKTVAYFPIFDAENAWCSLQRYGANIDQLRVQLYSISPSGQLRAGQDLPAGVDPIADVDFWLDYIDSIGVLSYCQTNGIEFIPVVYNYNTTINDFDQQAVHTMMTSPSLRTAHLDELEQLLVSHPAFDGIDIDYESLMASDRDHYSLFMEDLSTRVHTHGKLLTTAVHTKVGVGTWYGPQAQDYQRIGNAVDEMLIMTYDLHWATSPTYNNPPPTAGCQATSDWMNDVALFAITEINDPSKIQLGLPYYGYRWKHLYENHTLSDPGVGLTAMDAQQLIDDHNVSQANINRDPNGNEPYFIVDINGVDWVCYYQDGPSLSTKLQALDEYQLRDYIGGLGIWRLGGETDEMWEAVMQSMYGAFATVNTNFDCMQTSDPTGIDTYQSTTAITYPNPAAETITVRRTVDTEVTLTLTDLSGKPVQHFGRFTGREITLNLNEVATGVYFLQLTAKDGSNSTIRVMVSQ